MEAFRRITEQSGLTLHAAGDLRLDPDALKAEYATLQAELPEEERLSFGAAPGTGWTSIALVDGIRHCPALDLMPTVRSLLERHGDWQVRRVHLLRQPPRGKLGWHFDNQALHLSEARLLIAIHAPPGAVTQIGHEEVTYPEGQCWTGDFCFPHQVDNPTDRERVVIGIDLDSEAVIGLFPSALRAEALRRMELAQQAVGLMREASAIAA